MDLGVLRKYTSLKMQAEIPPLAAGIRPPRPFPALGPFLPSGNSALGGLCRKVCSAPCSPANPHSLRPNFSTTSRKSPFHSAPVPWGTLCQSMWQQCESKAPAREGVLAPSASSPINPHFRFKKSGSTTVGLWPTHLPTSLFLGLG